MYANFICRDIFSYRWPKCSSRQIQYKGVHYKAVRGRWSRAGCWETHSLRENWITVKVRGKARRSVLTPEQQDPLGPAVTAAQVPTQIPWAPPLLSLPFCPWIHASDTNIASEPMGVRKQAPSFKCDILIWMFCFHFSTGSKSEN